MIEVNSFVYLKLFPRRENRAVDNGRQVNINLHVPEQCPECMKMTMVESISLEYCGNCGYVEIDYWGLIPASRKKLTKEKINE